MANPNTIGVDSTLELFTTVLGWRQYEQIWFLLNDTGLVFIPFIGLLLRNVLVPIQSQQEGGASVTSLKRFELDLISALVVIILAGQPLIELKHDQLKFVNHCTLSDDNSQAFTQIQGIDDVKAYQDAVKMLETEEAKIPIWWYAVLSISSGINNAVKLTVPCGSEMIVSDYVIHKTFIPNTVDNPLRSDIKEYILKCYRPMANYINDDLKKQEKLLEEFNTAKDNFAREYRNSWSSHKHWLPQVISADGTLIIINIGNLEYLATTWVGSEFLLNADFPFTLKQRSIVVELGGFENKQKRISCRDYWLQPLPGQNKSIKDRLKALFDIKHLERLIINHKRFSQTSLGKAEIELMEPFEREHLFEYAMMRVVRGSFENKYKNIVTTQREFDDSSFQNSVTAKLGRELGGLALLFKFLTIFPMAKVVAEAAPVAQAVLLMALYMMLPIGLVFSGYSIQFLVVGAVGLFSLKFLGYVIFLANWMNNTFREAIKEAGYLGTGLGSNDTATIADLVMVNVYFVFPLIYLGVMGWAGYQLSTGIQGAYGALAGEESSAAKSSQAAGNMIKTEAINLGAKAGGIVGKAITKPVSVGAGWLTAGFLKPITSAMSKALEATAGRAIGAAGRIFRRMRGGG